MPPAPQLKPVTLDPKTTALLVIDMIKQTCNEKMRPRCVAEGTASHNGLLFTSVMAALRGFNVVVPVDGIAGNNAYEDQIAAYTLTSSIVYKVTLTIIDMIKFQ